MIRINVGGVHYETLLATLRSEESMLASMFSGKHKLERDKDGCPFIDRPGGPFRYILNFLRDRSIIPPENFTLEVRRISLACNVLQKKYEFRIALYHSRINYINHNKSCGGVIHDKCLH